MPNITPFFCSDASFNFGGGSMAPAAGAGTPGSAGFNFGTASPAPAGSTPFGAQNTGGLNLGIAKPQQSVQANNSLGLNLSTKGAGEEKLFLVLGVSLIRKIFRYDYRKISYRYRFFPIQFFNWIFVKKKIISIFFSYFEVKMLHF